jgi:predicted SnoaL-like aldol condensation-catalyzing enzyme
MSVEKTPAQANREIAIQFLRLAASGKVREAYETYVGPSFKHHNPFFAPGANALRAGMEKAAKEDPNKAFEIQRTCTEGGVVAVHSRVRKASKDFATVHIIRIEDGKIAELWDVVSEVPKDSPNTDGMF